MANTYEAWVMMDTENGVVSEEHDTPEDVLAEMQEKYRNARKRLYAQQTPLQ